MKAFVLIAMIVQLKRGGITTVILSTKIKELSLTAIELREVKAIIMRRFDAIRVELTCRKHNDYKEARTALLKAEKKDFDALEKQYEELVKAYKSLGYDPPRRNSLYSCNKKLQEMLLDTVRIKHSVDWEQKINDVGAAENDFIDAFVVQVIEGVDLQTLLDSIPTIDSFLK